MGATMADRSTQRTNALESANVARQRRCAVKDLMGLLGRGEARDALAALIAAPPSWLAGVDAAEVISWAPRMGARSADRLYARCGARQAHRLGELTDRQRMVLADELRRVGGAR